MKADAVIFDKDGTLIDFDAFWITVSIKAFEEVLRQFDKKDIPLSELFEPLGVHNGVVDINGVFCGGTYEQMGNIIYGVLKSYGCGASCREVIAAVTAAFNKNSNAGEVNPTCPNLKESLTALKKRGKRLALVTTDNEYMTYQCLKTLGIEELFEKTYTDDGKTPVKPDPYCAEEFLRLTGLEKCNAVMVGDTMTDINFAKNAGIAVIGIAKNEQNAKTLEPYADAVISDISELLNILE